MTSSTIPRARNRVMRNFRRRAAIPVIRMARAVLVSPQVADVRAAGRALRARMGTVPAKTGTQIPAKTQVKVLAKAQGRISARAATRRQPVSGPAIASIAVRRHETIARAARRASPVRAVNPALLGLSLTMANQSELAQ